MTLLAPGVARSDPRPATAAPRPRRGGAGDAGLALVDGCALAVAGAVTGAGWLAVAGYVLCGLAVLTGTGRHRLRITLRLGDELPGLLGCGLLPSVLLVPSAGRRALLAVPVLLVTMALGRAVSYTVLRAARRHRLVAEPVLLVGAGQLSCEIAETLTLHPEFGLVPYGFVASRVPVRPVPLPWLGEVPALPRLLVAHRIRRVIVCFPEAPDSTLVPVLRTLRGTPARVYLMPRLYELGQLGATAWDEVWGIPLIPLRGYGRAGPAVKRAVDVVLAALLLVALAPLLGVLAVLARMATGGRALFRQARVTGDGQVTQIIKLRSLAPDPDGDPAADIRWAVPDGRCTLLGRLLRTSHADELPQLVNVLRGEMSLVGPRPERPYFATRFAQRIPGYAARHRMLAGITGWAQVHGLCGDTSLRERARFDNRYIEDWTLWMDLVILVRTVVAVLPPVRRPR